MQFIYTIHSLQKELHIADAVHNDVTAAQVFIIHHLDSCLVGAPGNRISQILALCLHLLVINIHQKQFIRQSLEQEGIGTVFSNRSQTDNSNCSLFQNHFLQTGRSAPVLFF